MGESVVRFERIGSTEPSDQEDSDRKRAYDMYMASPVPVLGRIAQKLNRTAEEVRSWYHEEKWAQKRADLTFSHKHAVSLREEKSYEEILAAVQKGIAKISARYEHVADPNQLSALAGALDRHMVTMQKCYAQLKKRAGWHGDD